MPPGVRIRVAELLEEKGWTITRLMRESGLSYPTVHRLAHGDARAINLETIDRLCHALEVSVDELLVREEEEASIRVP